MYLQYGIVLVWLLAYTGRHTLGTIPHCKSSPNGEHILFAFFFDSHGGAFLLCPHRLSLGLVLISMVFFPSLVKVLFSSSLPPMFACFGVPGLSLGLGAHFVLRRAFLPSLYEGACARLWKKLQYHMKRMMKTRISIANPICPIIFVAPFNRTYTKPQVWEKCFSSSPSNKGHAGQEWSLLNATKNSQARRYPMYL